MSKSGLPSKIFFLLTVSFIFFTGCSPKIKIELWVRNHQGAASALETWGANHPDEAISLFNLDCTNRNQFKKKITDALNASQEEAAQQNHNTIPPYYPQGNTPSPNREDGFTSWCHKYPSAAKKLRSHAKAICKAGMGALNGSIKMK